MKNPITSLASARVPHRMSVTYRRTEELKPDRGNPHRHGKTQIRQIRNSIQTFGFNVPILIDPDGNVIAGHGRLLAARELGMTCSGKPERQDGTGHRFDRRGRPARD